MTPRSQNHLAELLGISRSTCSDSVKRGMPTDSLEAAQAWRNAFLDPARRKQAKPAPEVLQPLEQPPEPEETFDEARTRDMVSTANLREMAEAKRRGELIEVAAVTKVLASDYATTRDALLQLPARLGPMLAAEKDPATVQRLLHAEIHQALVTLAGTPDSLREIASRGDA
jgi:phage terminase Nu1 subunit (DNA packaging protein)